MNIVTSHDCPPLPIRSYDWSAHIKGQEEPGDPIGYGATEAEAIEDLLWKVEELQA